jgi:3-(3-hydroxy-phenyl)propionate hydroxylase
MAVTPNSEHAVLIIGGGPTGMMLAGELKLQGVDVAIVERRTDQNLTGRRAGGLHSRTLEVFDQRGIAERFIAAGQKVQSTGYAGVKFDISEFPTRHPYSLGLWQTHIERILLGWIEELGVPVDRGIEAAGFVQDEAGVDLALSDGRSLRGKYLVGCDGGRSLVRKIAGIDFPGSEATISNLIADVEMTETPPLGVHHTALGIHAFGRADYKMVDGQVVYADTGPIGVMVTEAQVGGPGEPTLDELKAALVAACGTDYGVHSPRFISRFTDAARQAAAYRKGRVLLAGDAAHIHPPDGGQRLHFGVQDAVNLGWKLAGVVNGVASESLLDTYQAERHPVVARLLRHTMASVAMRREDDRANAVRETMAELLELEEAGKYMAAEMSQLGVHYDLGEGHPLLGRRMPDLEIISAAGPQLVFTLLHQGQPVLLNFGAAGSLESGPWADRVPLVDAAYPGPWELPVLGAVPAPAAVLVRPDGYVAWVGEGSDAGLAEALERWFGPPSAP